MRSDTLYYLVIVFLEYNVYQGVGVTSKPTNDDNLIVFILAECKARLKSFAFGVFLFIKHISIHCRDPPFYQFENKSKLIGGNKMIKIIKKWFEDNEYKEIQYDTEIKQYYYCFKDMNKKAQRIAVERKIAAVYLHSSKIIKRQQHEYERHTEQSEIFENKLNERVMDKPLSLEDEFIRKSRFEDLINAINKLSDVQKRRIKMYYFEELNLEQIAKIEHTSFQMISKSIKQGIENLKKILKNKI